jgi:hypothetical protein
VKSPLVLRKYGGEFGEIDELGNVDVGLGIRDTGCLDNGDIV